MINPMDGSELTSRGAQEVKVAWNKGMKGYTNSGSFKKGETPKGSVLFKKGQTSWNKGKIFTTKEKKREIKKISQKKRYDNFQIDFKGNNDKISKVVWKKAEEITKDIILPKEGFSNIFKMEHKQFPYDILAEKEGIKYCIDVTTARSKRIKDYQYQIAKFFGAKFIVIVVKPDMSLYSIHEINKQVHIHNTYSLTGFKQVNYDTRNEQK